VSVCVYSGIWIFTFVVSYTVISFEYSYFIPLEFEADAQIRYLPAVLIRKLPPLSVSVPSMYSSTETGSYSCASSEYRFNIHSIDFTYLFSVVNSITVSVCAVSGIENSTSAFLFDEPPPPPRITLGVGLGDGFCVGSGVALIPLVLISHAIQNILNTSPRVIFPYGLTELSG